MKVRGTSSSTLEEKGRVVVGMFCKTFPRRLGRRFQDFPVDCTSVLRNHYTVCPVLVMSLHYLCVVRLIVIFVLVLAMIVDNHKVKWHSR